MTGKKSIFESNDLSSGLSLQVEEDDGECSEESKYIGKERRRENRRQSGDRRDEVRFEIKKTDRREKQGRRSDDNSPKFW